MARGGAVARSVSGEVLRASQSPSVDGQASRAKPRRTNDASPASTVRGGTKAVDA